ncbi:hypothetical protein OHA25_51680 [Nonomuraea sp. NBC_00507]|uniref:hypothetical protein n=1 Tax=Nonomuraea sp. NBC_00507 TaxID=2976002 RepID=UPI002E1962E3
MTRLIARAIRKDGYWIALFEGYPSGGVAGDTLAELHEEVDAVKHFVLDVPAEAVIDVEYVYDFGDEQAAAELSQYREVDEQAKALARARDAVAKRAAKALAAAGISERDGALMMGLSKQRVHQLKHAG